MPGMLCMPGMPPMPGPVAGAAGAPGAAGADGGAGTGGGDGGSAIAVPIPSPTAVKPTPPTSIALAVNCLSFMGKSPRPVAVDVERDWLVKSALSKSTTPGWAYSSKLSGSEPLRFKLPLQRVDAVRWLAIHTALSIW